MMFSFKDHRILKNILGVKPPLFYFLSLVFQASKSLYDLENTLKRVSSLYCNFKNTLFIQRKIQNLS